MAKNETPKRFSLLNDAEAKYANWFDSLARSKRRSYLIAAIALGLILVAATSMLALFQIPQFIYVVVGFPAGVILAILIYTIVEVKNKTITKYKDLNTPKNRIRHLILAWGFGLAVLVITSSQFPKDSFTGIGGMIVVCGFLFTIDLITRTEEEYYYYSNGLVDPREPITNDTDNEDD